MVKEGGLVKYNFSFTAGFKDIPAAAQFSVTLSHGLTALSPTCTCDAGSGAVAINAGATIHSTALARDSVWQCHFKLSVRNTEKLAGELPAFDIQLTFSGAGVTDAYYVPKVTTTAVPVYTGAMLDYVSNVADIADTTKFIDGKHLQSMFAAAFTCAAAPQSMMHLGTCMVLWKSCAVVWKPRSHLMSHYSHPTCDLLCRGRPHISDSNLFFLVVQSTTCLLQSKMAR